MKTLLYFVLVVVSINLAAPSQAHAYLDPGTGSVILQVIVAGLLGSIFTIKMWWRNIVNFFSRLFGKNTNNNAQV